MACPGPPSAFFYLEVVFIKRFVSIFLAFALAVMLAADFAPSGKAVAPLAFAQAALASYVASTGYNMYIENGTGDDLLGLTSDLYDTYIETHPAERTLALLLEGNFIFSDNSGHIVITKTAADCFQNFCEWLASNYNISAGGSAVTVIPSSSGNYYQFGSVQAYRPSFTQTTTVGNVTYYYDPVSVGTYNNGLNLYLACVSPAEAYVYLYNAGSHVSPCILPISSSYEKYAVLAGRNYAGVEVQLRPNTWTKVYATNIASNFTYNDVIPLSNVNPANVTTEVTPTTASSGLLLSLASNVLDKAGDMADDQSLVVGVGADIGASVTDIVSSVIAGYDAATGTLPVTDSVVDTAVIDTPVQPYPDVDSLGLPELGLALTTRFPFSIPWDIGAIYVALSHSEVPPIKTFDLIPPSVLARWGINASASITLDFTQEKYQVLFTIIHWACIIGFCLGLATLTKRYIWTTGG